MKNRNPIATGLCAAALLFLPLNGRAQNDKAAQGDKSAAKPAATSDDKAADKAKEAAPPPDSTTEGSVDVGGQHIAYTAIAGTITVGATDAQDAQLGPDGKPQPGSQLALNAPKEAKDAPPMARMFYVAYFKKDAKAEDRPITFFYNGGPGSSTVWLHMGSLGPKHVVTAGDTHLPAAPYTMVDNPNTLLDVSDLVFIDMPGTGFGRLIGKDAEKAFWGVDEDAGCVCAVHCAVHHASTSAGIRPSSSLARATGRRGRRCWPTNAGEHAEHRSERRDSAVADLQFHDRHRHAWGQSRAWTCRMSWRCRPIAATAWYHKKLPTQPAALEPFLKEVEEFAMGPYAHALAQGTDIEADEKQQVAEKLHEYTGLPVAYLLKANLRVSGGEFEKTLQDDADLTTGRLDTRFSGPNLDPLSENAEYDPQSSAQFPRRMCRCSTIMCGATLKYGDGQTYLPFAHIDRHFAVGLEAQRQSDRV